MQDHTNYRPAKCHLCEKSFKNKQDLASHIRCHKVIRMKLLTDVNEMLPKKHVAVSFDIIQTDLTMALSPIHSKDIRKYECDQCHKKFRSQSHMVYHRYAHFEERNFACDQCPQKFKSPHILRTHRNTVHSTVFRYECEQCGRKFKRDHHLVVSQIIVNNIYRLEYYSSSSSQFETCGSKSKIYIYIFMNEGTS